jgi:hypothetical protein
MQLPSWAIPEVVGPDLFASAKAYYTDGTESARQYKEVENNSENMVNYIPAGADQWELQLLAPAKRILKWDIQMYYTSASDGTKTALNEPYYFYADNRNDYKNVMLQFRNSLGGLDGLLVRGVIDHNLNYEFDEQARTFLADYFSGDYITPARIIANSRENKIFKGDVGPLTKEDQERIRDLNLERNAWWEIDDKWWPVNILTQNVKQKTTEDDRWSFPIEFSFAQHGDKYYTPDAIALGDRTFATNVCEAELTNITTEVDTSGPTASVQIDFDYTLGLLQFSYQIVGVHEDPVVANTGDLPITVNDLPLDATYALKLRPICSNGVIGRVFNAGFNTIGEGGTGGGGSGESEITNESGIDIETCVITSDGDEIYNGSLPAGITDLYTAPDETDVDVEVTIGFMPSACKLVSDGVEYWGIPKPAGAEFHHVTITGGMIITIY